MNLGTQGSLLRCSAVWLTVTAAAAAVLTGLAAELGEAASSVSSGDWTRSSFDSALVTLATVVLAGCAVWFWVVTSITVAEALTGRVRPDRRGMPAGLRGVILGACGVALVAGLTAPAQAVTTTINGTDSELLRGLPLPERVSVAHLSTPGTPNDRTTQTPDSQTPDSQTLDSQTPKTRTPESQNPAPSAPAPQRRVPPVSTDSVVVTTGDTLWELALERLGSDADLDEIAAYWPELYQANRATIGPDPDLLRPGQRLALPEVNPGGQQ